MSIESMMLSNHLILCHPLLLLPSIFPSIRVFSNESALCGPLWPFVDKELELPPSASVLPVNIQRQFPLGFTGLISLLSKGTLNHHLQHHTLKPLIHQCLAFVMVQLSHPLHHYWKNHSFDYMDLCCKVMSLLFNTLSRLVIAFLPRSIF